MKVGLYCIKDTKACFWKVHTQVNDLVARREFDNLINSNSIDFYSVNYSDLELWKLGTFDDATGEIDPDLFFICSGVDVKKVGD